MNALPAFAEELQLMYVNQVERRISWTDQLRCVAEKALPFSLIFLIQRIALATIFLLSGRTKVEGWFTFTDTTFELFRSEYAGVPLPSDLAAVMATVSEHVFPVMLVLGLFTRFSALALLGMTAVIQIFVYPDAWPTHLSWAALALPLVAAGGGRLSLDELIFGDRD